MNFHAFGDDCKFPPSGSHHCYPCCCFSNDTEVTPATSDSPLPDPPKTLIRTSRVLIRVWNTEAMVAGSWDDSLTKSIEAAGADSWIGFPNRIA